MTYCVFDECIHIHSYFIYVCELAINFEKFLQIFLFVQVDLNSYPPLSDDAEVPTCAFDLLKWQLVRSPKAPNTGTHPAYGGITHFTFTLSHTAVRS